MSEIKLFQISGQNAIELKSESVGLEKSLQTLIENNLETILGIEFIKSEHSTGKAHGGRIDTLGIDENGCPVIIEYKRTINENVINQGLFYLDWLLDHKAEFEMLLLKKHGGLELDEIDWSAPRLVCIAGDFTKYDVHAVRQINRNIDLIRYSRFTKDFLALELVNRTSMITSGLAPSPGQNNTHTAEVIASTPHKPIDEKIAKMTQSAKDTYESLRTFLLALGDDVEEKQLKLYMAYRRIKNFVCIVVHGNKMLVYLKINPDTVRLEAGFTKDVRNKGHWGTGDLEITINNIDDLRRAEPLLLRSYEEA